MISHHNQSSQQRSRLNDAQFAHNNTINQPSTSLPMPEDPNSLTQIDLPTLVRFCYAQSECFYRRQPHDTRFAHELFRRALVEHNEIAWAQIYYLYFNLVEFWVRRNHHFVQSGESSEFFVTAAFIRFWRAITPERFATFPNLAALLQYLQLCTQCAVTDSVRIQPWANMFPVEIVPDYLDMRVPPDEEAIERVIRSEFWRYINTLLHNDAERIVVFGIFLGGMKPGDIYTKHHNLFSSVNNVYSIKRNVLVPLGRSKELQQMASI